VSRAGGALQTGMSNALTVQAYEPAQRDRWDSVVRGARARHFMFERAYMDYHQDRFADASWFVLLGDRPIAVLPASAHGAELVSHGGLTFGGLVSTRELTTVRAIAAFEVMAPALRAAGFGRLVYKPMPHLYHLEPAEEDLYALSSAGGRLVAREVTAAVPPGAPRTYSHGRRHGIRAACGRVELAESDQIEEFWDLLRDVLAERHGVQPVHSAPELRVLADRFPGRIRLFVASEAAEIVAGTLVFQTPVVAHAQYIAVGPRGRELFALDALTDYLLAEVYPQMWFDFGISNERDGSINEGLVHHKESYGARAIVHDRYALDLTTR
jgi:Acetyltransferase (GNAT) domain